MRHAAVHAAAVEREHHLIEREHVLQVFVRISALDIHRYEHSVPEILLHLLRVFHDVPVYADFVSAMVDEREECRKITDQAADLLVAPVERGHSHDHVFPG